ncbi:MAG: methyltransferase domain-containing protein [Pseudomonadota bacterium]
MSDFTLESFTAMDEAGSTSPYVQALKAFDAIEQLQALKQGALEWCDIADGASVLDVGCGFGLETLRLAQLNPNGITAGVDLSEDFIHLAQVRAKAASLNIAFQVANAMDLPFPENHFDVLRSERVLIYLDDVAAALREAKRVLHPGGRLALIEPEFSSTTVNLPNRALVRRVMAHEVDTAVVQSWLPGQLHAMLPSLGFIHVELESRVLVFPQHLAREYFDNVGSHAASAGVINSSELDEWQSELNTLSNSGNLFGSIGYFLFKAQA